MARQEIRNCSKHGRTEGKHCPDCQREYQRFYQRKRQQRWVAGQPPEAVPVAVPGLEGEDLYYRDYKEPLQPLEGGHGFLGVLIQDRDGRLLCSICGRTWINLGQHVLRSHGMPVADYKNENGLLQKTALVADSLREFRSVLAHRRIAEGSLQKLSPEAMAKRQSAPSHGAMSKMKPEYLNKTGRCYQQVIAVGRMIVERDGKLRRDAASSMGIGEKLINRYFGSMAGYRAVVGAKQPIIQWDRTELLFLIQNLGRSLGRTPTPSDARRFGLPADGVFRRAYGSWTNAVRAAGLIPVSDRWRRQGA